MSVQQLINPNFIQQIHDIREQIHVPAEKLRIEITERTMTEEPEKVREIVDVLTGEGVGFYLDDFGTGL